MQRRKIWQLTNHLKCKRILSQISAKLRDEVLVALKTTHWENTAVMWQSDFHIVHMYYSNYLQRALCNIIGEISCKLIPFM